ESCLEIITQGDNAPLTGPYSRCSVASGRGRSISGQWRPEANTMMRHEWKTGDRVRLRRGSLANAYLPGFRGTILGGKEASVLGWESYFVRMDGEPIGSWI